jgi:hypothetical protein
MPLMISRAPGCLLFAVLLAMVHRGVAAAAAGPSGCAGSDAGLPWRSLELVSEGVLTRVTTRAELEKVAASAVLARLIEAPGREPRQPSGERVAVLTVQSDIRMLAGGFETKSRLWFDPGDGSPLQLSRTRRGRDDYEKIYRFTDGGVYRVRRTPDGPREAKLPPARWSLVKESYYPLSGQDKGCAGLLESSQLLYVLSASPPPAAATPREYCVFDRQALYRVRVVQTARESAKTAYVDTAGHARRPDEARVDAYRLGLSAGGGGDEDEPAFSFLGLQGDIRILLSATERLPLRVGGKVPGFGSVELELRQLER